MPFLQLRLGQEEWQPEGAGLSRRSALDLCQLQEEVYYEDVP